MQNKQCLKKKKKVSHAQDPIFEFHFYTLQKKVVTNLLVAWKLYVGFFFKASIMSVFLFDAVSSHYCTVLSSSSLKCNGTRGLLLNVILMKLVFILYSCVFGVLSMSFAH